MINNGAVVLQYCPAEQEDIAVILKQCEMLILHYEDLASIDLPKVLAWVENKIRSNLDRYICVKQCNQKVAYYHLEKGNTEAELDDLYVLPEFRGNGIGSQILHDCIAATDLPIFLYVFKNNTAAIDLYQRFGFRITESVGKTRLIMRLDRGKC